MKRKKRLRALITNMGLFFGVLAFALAGAELVTRILYSEVIVMFPRYHTDIEYGDFTLRRVRPNSDFTHRSIDGSWRFVTNSAGFRNTVDFDYEKRPEVIRVLSLGDSHTQGYEVRQESTFSAVAERYLLHNVGATEVLNAGVSGFSNAEELAFFENEGKKFAPDVVVVGFFANDLEDNIKAGLFALDDNGELQTAKFQHIPGVKIQNIIYSIPGVQWMSEHSYFYSFLFNATWEFFKSQLAEESEENVSELAVAQNVDFSSYQIELAAQLLLRLSEACKSIDAKLIIVDIPGFGRTKLESSVPISLLPAVIAASDRYIGSEELLSEYAGAVDLHIAHGHRHISEFTHAIIGTAIGEAIVSMLAEHPDPTLQHSLVPAVIE